MTLVNLYRKYQRWNPVHPTTGAFWGIGVGLGCGVGWGPGFGPEVVGYVGSGCGLGLSIGVTLIGIGIGLPASGLTNVPCDMAVHAGQEMIKFAGDCFVPAIKGAALSGYEIARKSSDSLHKKDFLKDFPSLNGLHNHAFHNPFDHFNFKLQKLFHSDGFKPLDSRPYSRPSDPLSD